MINQASRVRSPLAVFEGFADDGAVAVEGGICRSWAHMVASGRPRRAASWPGRSRKAALNVPASAPYVPPAQRSRGLHNRNDHQNANKRARISKGSVENGFHDRQRRV